MKRGMLILAAGVVAAALAFGCFYFIGTATPRVLMRSEQPELAWLRHEFNLNDAEFKRVSELHADYLPQCMERCRRIDLLNTALSDAIDSAMQVTPEIEKVLRQRAEMRATCQSDMLKHFFEVSRTMSPEQGHRYLAWIRENTCVREETMVHRSETNPRSATAHGR
jgi:hypothetical protein